MPVKYLCWVLLVVAVAARAVGGASGQPEAKKLPLDGQMFQVEGQAAFLIMPKDPAPGVPTPWVWYAPTLPRLPGPEERWMFEKFLAAGLAVAGVDVGESYGSPKGRAGFTALYRELTEIRQARAPRGQLRPRR